VPSGTYELTVNVAGFKKFVQENLQVIVATDARKDVVLDVVQPNPAAHPWRSDRTIAGHRLPGATTISSAFANALLDSVGLFSF
jgi:hypothetical protein